MIDRQALGDAAFRYGVPIVLVRDVRLAAWVIEADGRRQAVRDERLADMRWPALATAAALNALLARRRG